MGLRDRIVILLASLAVTSGSFLSAPVFAEDGASDSTGVGVVGEGWTPPGGDRTVPQADSRPLGQVVSRPDEGVELTELPGDSWAAVDLTGTGEVVPTAKWQKVAGTLVELRLSGRSAGDSQEGDDDPESEAQPVTVTTSKASDLGPGVLRIDLVTDAGVAGGLEARVALDEVSSAFGGALPGALEVERATFPSGCDDDLTCAEIHPVEAAGDAPTESVFTVPADVDAVTESVESADSTDSTEQGSTSGLEGDTGPVIAGESAAGGGDLAAEEDSATSLRASGSPETASGSGAAVTLLVSGDSTAYAATPTNNSAAWQVGEGTGEFSYSYALELPDPLGAGTPTLGFSYSSGSVDAMTLNANGQASAVGVGWNLSESYVTRSFAACADDGMPASGELCWKTRGEAADQYLWEDLALVLNGRSSELVPIGTGGNEFRLRDDPGWRVTRITSATGSLNHDNDREAFKVETPDGSTYWFGESTESKSVWTVPVRGNDAGEPCHAAGVCQQAWRWNLDRSQDSNGNLTSYLYDTETNYYVRGGTAANVAYDAAGRLAEVRYASQVDIEGDDPVDGGTPRARVLVNSVLRCAPPDTGEDYDDPTWDCPNPSRDAEVMQRYVDTPLQLKCAEGTGCDQQGPSFFSTYRYSSFVTQVRGPEDVWEDVDRYELTHSFPDGHDVVPAERGTGSSAADSEGVIVEPHLWLKKIRRFGLAESPSVALPGVKFGRIMLDGRVNPPEGARTLTKPRISSVTTELGGVIEVYYGHENPCDRTYVEEGSGAGPLHEWESTRDCFAQWYTPTNDHEWFHKYLVMRVGRWDQALHMPPVVDRGEIVATRQQQRSLNAGTNLGEWEVNDYDYLGDPGWRYTDNRNVPQDRESWDDWRGYETVRISSLESKNQELTGDVLSVREVTRYRGMSNSLRNRNGEMRNDKIDTVEFGTPANEPEDRRYMQGRVAEVTVKDNATPLTRTYTGYDAMETTRSPYADARAAHIVHEDIQRTYTRLVGTGTDRVRTVETEVHPGGTDHRGVLAGAVLSREDRTAGTFSICSESQWLGSGDSWMRAPSASRTWRGECSASDRVKEAEVLSFYDGATPGTSKPLRKGNLTLKLTTLSGTAVADDKYTYDRFGRLLGHSDPRDKNTTTTYTPTGVQPIETIDVTNHLGHTETTQLSDLRGQPVSSQDANGSLTSLTYDALGRLRTVRKPGNTSTNSPDTPSIEYRYQVAAEQDDPMRIATITQRHGNTTDWTYNYFDGWGRPIETQVPSRYYPDAVSTTELSGRVVSATGYDSRGLVAFDMPGLANTAEPGSEVLNPDPDPDQDETIDLARYSHTKYDALDRPLSVEISYSKRPGATVTPALTLYSYPGDKVRTKPAAGGWTDTLLNTRGQTTRAIRFSGPGSGAQLDATYTYTATGQLKTIKSDRSRYKEDPLACRGTCIITVADPETWTYNYDLAGRRTTAVDPDTGTSTTIFDDSGNVTQTVDGAGRTLNTTYDDLNRPTITTDGSGRVLIERTYDTGVPNAKGRQVSASRHNYEAATDRVVTTSVTGFDERGNPAGNSWTYPKSIHTPTAVGTDTVAQSATYNANDSVAIATTNAIANLPLTTLAYQYNEAGLAESITSPQDGATPVDSSRFNALNELTYFESRRPGNAGGMNRWYGWNEGNGQLNTTSATALGQGAVQQGTRVLEYDHDKAGNVSQISATNGSSAAATWCYTYDGFNRLTRAYTANGCTTPGANDRSITQATYDINYAFTRNQLMRVDISYQAPGATTAASATTMYDYVETDTGHAPNTVPTGGIVPTGTKTVRYNQAGDVTGQGSINLRGNFVASHSYNYDAFGRYAQLTAPGKTESYIYDAEGMRVALITQRGATRSSVITAGPVTIKNGTTASLHVTHVDGTPLGARNGSTWTWDWADAQGNVRFSSTSTALSQREYTPEGTVLSVTSVAAGDRGYLNKVHDEPDEVQLDHRKFATSLRTFLNPDPLLAPFDVQTLNPYAYAAYNPTSKSDANGLGPVGGETIGGGNGPTCLGSQSCTPDPTPSEDEVQLPITVGDNPACNGNSAVCDGIIYPFGNYGAANNMYYADALGRITAYHDPSYVGYEPTWGDVVKKVGKGAANFLVLDAVRSCAGGDAVCALEVAAVFAKPLKGARYLDDLAEGGSALAHASATAFRLADRPGDAFIKNKHLAGAGGRVAKFNSDDIAEIQGWISKGLRSDGVRFYPNGVDGTFRAVVPAGRVIGTKGQTNIRVIITDDGRAINAFPVHDR